MKPAKLPRVCLVCVDQTSRLLGCISLHPYTGWRTSGKLNFEYRHIALIHKLQSLPKIEFNSMGFNESNSVLIWSLWNVSTWFTYLERRNVSFSKNMQAFRMEWVKKDSRRSAFVAHEFFPSVLSLSFLISCCSPAKRREIVSSTEAESPHLRSNFSNNKRTPLGCKKNPPSLVLEENPKILKGPKGDCKRANFIVYCVFSVIH